jgi:hypothetical protein
MESFENSTESDPRKEVDAFIKSFEGLTLETADGKSVEIELEKMNVIPHTAEDLHSEGLVVRFKGHGIEQGDGNYLALIINPDYRFIEISLVRLTNKDLQGKNIYQELMKHMGAHFPKGFTLRANIEHDKTKEKITKLFNRFKESSITEDDLKAGIRKSGMVRIAEDAGFNNIKAVLSGDDIEIRASKNMESETITLSTAIQEPEDSQP